MKVSTSSHVADDAGPTNEDLADATHQAGTHNAFWFRHHRPVMHKRYLWWRLRRLAHELLQKADMEDIMETSARRKLQAVGDVVDDGADAVQPVVARVKLARGGDLKGGGCAMMEAKPHLISNLKPQLPMILVVVVLVDGLGLLETQTNVREELVSYHNRLGHRRDTRIARLVRSDRRRVMAVDHSEGRVLERGLEGGVVQVLYPRKPV
jgi:hypothetical protein